jgi:competence protein ComEC
MRGIGLGELSACLLGATALWLAPTLPPPWLSFASIPLAIILAWRWPRLRLPAAVLLGAAWVAGFAGLAMERRPGAELADADVVLDLRVTGLPDRGGRGWRFDAVVERSDHEALRPGSLLRLSWFGAEAELHPGSRWRVEARLRPPRGSLNPGGFDFERHALERGIVATGSVRRAHRLSFGPGPGIDALRARQAARLAALAPGDGGALLRALTVGDRRGLQDRHWDVLRATGTSHLMAISGLHVGLVAAMGALLGRGAVWLWPRLALRMPARFWALLAALPPALGYAALAGFAVPTRRALLMLLVAALALLLRRHASGLQVLLLAAVSVLVLDPLAIFGASFWLSVLGVAALILFARGPVRSGPVGRLVQAQGVLALALLPATVLFFGYLSLAAPLANLAAVPWVGFMSVPLGLIGTGLGMLVPALGDLPLRLAAASLEWIWRLLEGLASAGWAMSHLPAPSTAAWLLASVGIGVLLLPRGTPGKVLGAVLLLPLLRPDTQPAEGALRLTVFDVGQGTALLVQTREHALLYDAGPAHAGGLDLGEATVVPALRALGVRQLDHIIVSQAARDHAGGLEALQRAFPEAHVRASGMSGIEPCLRGQSWSAAGVRFSILHPPEFMPYLGNDSACVLRVEAPGGALLLTGDIGALVERRLLREQPEAIRADVLLVPRHGSRSSSSTEFLDAVEPRLAVVSVGWPNRFGQPDPDVLERYRQRGIAVLSTAECGALAIELDRDGSLQIRAARARAPRFWRAPCA